MDLNAVLPHLDKVRKNGDGYIARCIAHDDRNPSMSIRQEGDMLLFHCHAGCSQEDIIDVLRSQGLWGGKQSSSLYRVPFRPVIPPQYEATEKRARRAVTLSTAAQGNHLYLVKKGVQPNGIGVLGGLYKDLPSPVRSRGNVLVIPMQNIHGDVLSCQFIAEDGSKAYMAGSKRKGGFYFMQGGERLWICEGFATGASLHEESSDSVACAFDTNGLLPVAGALTAIYPGRAIIIMADDDWQTDGNPGVTKAREAADVTGVKVVVPSFSGLNRNPKDTDYNDARRLQNGG